VLWNPRDFDLIGGRVHQLLTRQLLKQIEIDMSGKHVVDIALKLEPLTAHLGELFLLHTELGLRIDKREHAARTPDGVIGKVANDRA